VRGRTPGGEGFWRAKTPAELAEMRRHEQRINLERSAEAHAVCPEKWMRLDGTTIVFRAQFGCPTHYEECAALWEPVTCGKGPLCDHST
jgi:hypothetical protein